MSRAKESGMDRDLYTILGIAKNAPDVKIRRAYRNLALRFHPDKNKNKMAEESFKRIGRAYEVLGDKRKRLEYDRQRESAAETDESSSDGDEDNTYEGTFLDYMRARMAYEQAILAAQQANSMYFFGATEPVPNFEPNYPPYQDFEPQTQTQTKSSWFSPATDASSCGTEIWQGGGKSEEPLKQDPPTVHELFIPLEEILTGCIKTEILWITSMTTGQARQEKKFFNIVVKPGCEDGTEIVFQKHGDQQPGKLPSDVVFVIRDRPDPLFKREGSNIKFIAKLSLKEALCGTTVEVPVLLGVPLILTTRGKAIQPNAIKCLPCKGLPHPNDPAIKGHLLVKFEIEFPDSLSVGQKEKLLKLLPD